MPKIVNRAYMTTATTGTGTITLGSAVGSFRSFAASGVVDGDVVRYVIEDGDNWEIGSGTYAATGTTLTRAVEDSSSGGTAITLSGNAVVFVTAVAADFGGGDALGTVTGADLDLSTGNFFEVTAADQTLTFSNPPAAHGFTVKVTGAGTVSGYDMSVASYDGVSFSVAGEETNPQSIAFSADGTKMYTVGSVSDTVYQYTLTSQFDLATASYDNVSFSVAAQESFTTGMALSANGEKMFILGRTSDFVHQYTLTTAFDLATASYDNVSFSLLTQEPSARDFCFGANGTKMFVIGDNDFVYQYTLTTGFDVSTASYDNVSFSTAAQETAPAGIAFNSEGTKIFLVGTFARTVYQYTLTAAFDVSTASYDSVSFSVEAQDAAPQSIAFSADGTKMYTVGSVSDTVYQYTTSSATAATITYPASVTFEAGSPPAAPAVGAVKTVDLYTVNGGTNYYDKG